MKNKTKKTKKSYTLILILLICGSCFLLSKLPTNRTPTEPLPTSTLTIEQTSPTPTEPPTSTATVQPPTPKIIILTRNAKNEYVDIKNTGTAPQSLAGWSLLSETGSQNCPLDGVLQPGQTLRIWAKTQDADKGGFNCGFSTNIWNNQDYDPAVLYNQNNLEIDRK